MQATLAEYTKNAISFDLLLVCNLTLNNVSGTFGVVHKGHYTKNGKRIDVAIKSLKGNFLQCII